MNPYHFFLKDIVSDMIIPRSRGGALLSPIQALSALCTARPLLVSWAMQTAPRNSLKNYFVKLGDAAREGRKRGGRMNNKYGYRLVDILKRGRGRKFPARPSRPSPRDRSEKGIKADRGDEGQGEIRPLVTFLCLNCSN